MIVMAEPTRTPRKPKPYRSCPHCKTGIGTCDGTEHLGESAAGEIKRRGYKCESCEERWYVEIEVIENVLGIRYVRVENNRPS